MSYHSRQALDRLIAENERLIQACQKARLALAAAYESSTHSPAGGVKPAESTSAHHAQAKKLHL